MILNHDELKAELQERGVTSKAIVTAEAVEGSLGLEDLATATLGYCDYDETTMTFYLIDKGNAGECDCKALKEKLIDTATDTEFQIEGWVRINVNIDCTVTEEPDIGDWGSHQIVCKHCATRIKEAVKQAINAVTHRNRLLFDRS